MEWCAKVMGKDGSYCLYLLLHFSSATMITQPTPISRLQHHVVYKSLHVVHCMTHCSIHEVSKLTSCSKVQNFTGHDAGILSVFPKCDQKANFDKPFICCEYTVHVVE